MDAFPFAELETDQQAIAAFVARENARTEAAFPDELRAADEAALRAILESPDDMSDVVRLGPHIYTFHQTADNPRGRWLRIPQEVSPTADAPWVCAFDVDAFCRETGAVWVWSGAVPNPFDPARVLISLSEEGSDLIRYLEFDLVTCQPVPGGFDLGPDRSEASWAGPDSLILGSALPGDATHAGWSGALRRLERGAVPATAPLIHRASHESLLISGGVGRLGGSAWLEVWWEMPAINMARVTVLRPDGETCTLPNPRDTCPVLNHAYCAWVANEEGPHASGTLVLCRHDGSAARILFEPEQGRVVRSDGIFFVDDWLVWTEMHDLVPHLMVLDTRIAAAQPCEIVPPVAAEDVWITLFDATPETGDGTLMLTVTGYLKPVQRWLFDLGHGVEAVVFRPYLTAPEHFESAGCDVRLWHATIDDGTRVPYHIVLPRGHEGRNDIPVMLYGYGGFADSLTPGYRPLTGKAWIERGGAYVEAHIRGGGELGPSWHSVAKQAGRSKTFADFAAVAADLVQRGITRAERIGCHGASNGGLLCGVMLTRYPERFGAVWASVGVFDMLNFTRFPAGKGWIDEYGDPAAADARDWLASYSPLHNIPQRPLPPALIDTSEHDDRVDPSHSRRFVAALQAAGHAPYFITHRGGHGGGGASHETAREMAFGFAFLRKALKIDQ